MKRDEIFSFSREEEILVKGAAGEYRARALILAPGAKRLRPAGLNVQDYEGAGVSYCVVCDGFFFRGKRVALLGDGEYARHELAELANFTEDVTVLTNGGAGEFPGAKVRREPVEALYGDCLLYTSVKRRRVGYSLGCAGQSCASARRIGTRISERLPRRCDVCGRAV